MFKELVIRLLFWVSIAIALIVIGFAPVIFAWSAWWLFLTVPAAALVAVAMPRLVYMLAVLTHGSH